MRFVTSLLSEAYLVTSLPIHSYKDERKPRSGIIAFCHHGAVWWQKYARRLYTFWYFKTMRLFYFYKCCSFAFGLLAFLPASIVLSLDGVHPVHPSSFTCDSGLSLSPSRNKATVSWLVVNATKTNFQTDPQKWEGVSKFHVSIYKFSCGAIANIHVGRRRKKEKLYSITSPRFVHKKKDMFQKESSW